MSAECFSIVAVLLKLLVRFQKRTSVRLLSHRSKRPDLQKFATLSDEHCFPARCNSLYKNNATSFLSLLFQCSCSPRWKLSQFVFPVPQLLFPDIARSVLQSALFLFIPSLSERLGFQELGLSLLAAAYCTMSRSLNDFIFILC